jgi:alkylhydroperoxidase family enzyme
LGAEERWLAAVCSESTESDKASTGSLDGLDESWKLALHYAELVNESGHSVSDADYQALAKHWDDGEIIELTMVIGLFNYFNRFNDALRVEITK